MATFVTIDSSEGGALSSGIGVLPKVDSAETGKITSGIGVLPLFNTAETGRLYDQLGALPSIFTYEGNLAYNHSAVGGVKVGGNAVIAGDPLIALTMSGGVLISGVADFSVSSPTASSLTMLGGVLVGGSAVVATNWKEMVPSGGIKIGGSATVTGRGTYELSADSAISVADNQDGRRMISALANALIAAESAGLAPTVFVETVNSIISSTTGAAGYLLFFVSADSGITANSQAPVSAIYAVSVDSVAHLLTGTQFVIDFTDGWAYNLNTGAASFYEGFKFNSFAMVDGEYYGANEQGIYRLGADNDAGADIDAIVTLGTSRLGSDFVKTVPGIYAGARSDELMMLTCRVEGQEYSYAFSRRTENMAPIRVVPGKGLKGAYWQIEIANTAGADIEVDNLSVTVAPTLRKA